MTEQAYEVGAALLMKTNVPQVMREVADSFKAFDELLRPTQEKLEGIGGALKEVKGAAASLKTLAASLEKIGNTDLKGAFSNLEKLTKAVGGVERAVTEGVGGAWSAVAERIGTATDRVGLAKAATGEVANEVKGVAAAWRDVSSAITAAKNDAKGAVSPSSRVPASAQRAAAAAGKPHVSMDDVGMAGMAVGAAGAGGTGAVLDVVHSAMDPAQTLWMIRQDRRVTPGQVDSVDRAAWDATKSAPGSTYGKNLEAALDLKNVLGSLDEAREALPAFAKLSTVLQMVDVRRGGKGDPAFAAAKALEILGGITEETKDANGNVVRTMSKDKLDEHLKKMTAVVLATQGRVDQDEYLRYARQGRVGGMMADDKFTYEELPALMLAIGGSRTGTAINSMNQVFLGGKVTAKTMSALISMGLASKDGVSMAKNPHTGKMEEQVNEGSIYDQNDLKHDIVEFVRDAKKRMEARGIKTTDDQLIAIQKGGQRSTIAGVLADTLKDLPSIDKERQNIRATSPDLSFADMASSPVAMMQRLQASFENFKQALGGPALAPAIDVMDSLTKRLNQFGQWAKDNKDEAEVLVKVAAIASVVATGLGAVGVALWTLMPFLSIARGMGIIGKAAPAVVGAAAAAGAGAAGAAETAALVGAETVAARGLLARSLIGATRLAGPVGLAMTALDLSSNFFSSSTTDQQRYDSVMARHPEYARSVAAAQNISTPTAPPAIRIEGTVKVSPDGSFAVAVSNIADIARATTTATVAAITRQLSAPPTGASDFSMRSAPVYPGTPVPAH